MSATLQGHALLAGDFIARVGNLPDPWVKDVGHGIPPWLLNTDNTINSHGRKLMRLCEDSAMILCTGRTPGDTPALPSFKAQTNTVTSRLDHVLVDPDLFSSIHSCCIGPIRDDSDHMPLKMHIVLSAAAPPSPPPVQHHTPTWVWDEAKREPYALALQAGPCQASLQQGIASATVGNVHLSDSHFNGAVNSAASAAGLRQTCCQALSRSLTGWGYRAPCSAPYSPCMMGACSPQVSTESLGTARPPPWGCGRAAPSAPPWLASSLMACTTT